MGRKNIIILFIILLVFFAIDSYAQTVQRDLLLSVNGKLDQYKIKQVSIATASFQLYDYYNTIGLAEISAKYGEVGVLVDKTIQDTSSIQEDIVRNLDNYEGVRIMVRNKLSELRNTHDLAEIKLNQTTEDARVARPTIPEPEKIEESQADDILSNSYKRDAKLYYSDQSGETARVITRDEIKQGKIPNIIAELPQGGSTLIEFTQTVEETQKEPPTDIIPECALRLRYVSDAVTGSNLVASGRLVALGGIFEADVLSCMFKIGGVSFYNIEPIRKTDENTIYCALPPGVAGEAEAWVIGRDCRESEHVSFRVGA